MKLYLAGKPARYSESLSFLGHFLMRGLLEKIIAFYIIVRMKLHDRYYMAKRRAKSVGIFLFLISLLGGSEALAQQKSVTQEEVELEYLNRYEEKTDPVRLLPLVKNRKDDFLYGARIQRFMTLLTSAHKNKRQPVSILIYGQSITGSKIFTDLLKEYLEEKYPDAIFSITNRSIGGFGGEQLVRTAEHDLYDTCCDLIIFHVYGGEEHGELETIFSNIRRRTTADILLLNHHISSDNTIDYDKSSYSYLNFIANKYNCELVDVTKEWAYYLIENNLKTKDLLRDNIHPNRHGNWLLVQLIGKHLRLNTLFPNTWYDQVQTYYVNTAVDSGYDNPIRFKNGAWDKIDDVYCGKNSNTSLILRFQGSRIDIVAGAVQAYGKLGSAEIRIDGKPVSKCASLYAITRPTAGPGTWWPLIRRIEHSTSLIPEAWTMRIDKVNADSTIWTFSVYGSETGFDGSGSSDETFISKSGRVIIHKDDFMFLRIKDNFQQVVNPGFEAKWEVYPLFKELYQAPRINDSSIVHKTTIVQGLTNDSHTLEIIPAGDGIVPIEAIEIHRPPLTN